VGRGRGRRRGGAGLAAGGRDAAVPTFPLQGAVEEWVRGCRELGCGASLGWRSGKDWPLEHPGRAHSGNEVDRIETGRKPAVFWGLPCAHLCQIACASGSGPICMQSSSHVVSEYLAWRGHSPRSLGCVRNFIFTREKHWEKIPKPLLCGWEAGCWTWHLAGIVAEPRMTVSCSSFPMVKWT
jgi:hypothetical protein